MTFCRRVYLNDRGRISSACVCVCVCVYVVNSAGGDDEGSTSGNCSECVLLSVHWIHMVLAYRRRRPGVLPSAIARFQEPLAEVGSTAQSVFRYLCRAVCMGQVTLEGPQYTKPLNVDSQKVTQVVVGFGSSLSYWGMVYGRKYGHTHTHTHTNTSCSICNLY